MFAVLSSLKTLKLSKLFVVTMVSLMSVYAQATLKLNGVASYKELNKEYYIGGLLLDDYISNPDDIRLYKKQKQMKLIVTTKRWSARQWQKQWQNNIAINNTLLGNDKGLQKDLAYFTSFLSEDLTNGDELVIDYHPNKGTRIRLNDFEFIETRDDALFNYLVNTWIGKLPPSREFKNRILTLHNDPESAPHKQLIANNTVVSKRRNQTRAWFGQTEEERVAQEAEEAARVAAENQKNSELKQKKAQELAMQKLKRRQAEKRKKEKLEQQRKQKLAKLEAEKKAEKAAQAKAAKAKRRAREKAAAKARAKKLKLIKEQKAQEAQLAQYYFRDLHQWKLRQAILSEVQYPAWAKQFNQEGVVDAQFKVNRKGIVSDVTFLDENTPEMLTAEVLRAIKVSAQKVLPPDELKGTQWEFTVTYQFDLLDSKQKTIESPTIPEHMMSQGGSYSLKAAGKYMQTIRERVIDAIKYPAEAIMLKKRGKASIFVTMDAKGNVVKVFERHASKHAVLNKAMTDAVERAKPLPAMPVDLGKDTITVDIEYEFKR